MSKYFYTVIIAAAFLITMPSKGFSLKCLSCHSVKSWDDCLENSEITVCEDLFPATVIDPSQLVCAKIHDSKLLNNSRQIDGFSKTCLTKDMCDREKCRYEVITEEERRITKSTYCEIECCNEDGCNQGKTMSSRSKAGGLSFSFVHVMTFVVVVLTTC